MERAEDGAEDGSWFEKEKGLWPLELIDDEPDDRAVSVATNRNNQNITLKVQNRSSALSVTG